MYKLSILLATAVLCVNIMGCHTWSGQPRCHGSRCHRPQKCYGLGCNRPRPTNCHGSGIIGKIKKLITGCNRPCNRPRCRACPVWKSCGRLKPICQIGSTVNCRPRSPQRPRRPSRPSGPNSLPMPIRPILPQLS